MLWRVSHSKRVFVTTDIYASDKWSPGEEETALTGLISVNLWNGTALENVDGLANCTMLKCLSLEGCKRVNPRPPVESMATRKDMATHQELLKE